MPVGLNREIGAAADAVAKGGEELDEQGRGVSLGVRPDQADELAGQAAERRRVQFRQGGGERADGVLVAADGRESADRAL